MGSVDIIHHDYKHSIKSERGRWTMLTMFDDANSNTGNGDNKPDVSLPDTSFPSLLSGLGDGCVAEVTRNRRNYERKLRRGEEQW